MGCIIKYEQCLINSVGHYYNIISSSSYRSIILLLSYNIALLTHDIVQLLTGLKRDPMKE